MSNKYTDYIKQIGPLSSKLFSKMQLILDDLTEAQRYEVCYNMLVLWKKQEEPANEDSNNGTESQE